MVLEIGHIYMARASLRKCENRAFVLDLGLTLSSGHYRLSVEDPK